MSRTYLIDANCLIRAKNDFYPFDLAPSFWIQLETYISDGTIKIHEAVYQEIKKGKDELTDWINEKVPGKRINIRDGESMGNYGKVMSHISSCGFYKESAIADWANETVADPQLIASAITYGYVLVTFEKSQASSRSKSRKQKSVKIPDVARDFGADCITLYDMMRELHFKL